MTYTDCQLSQRILAEKKHKDVYYVEYAASLEIPRAEKRQEQLRGEK